VECRLRSPVQVKVAESCFAVDRKLGADGARTCPFVYDAEGAFGTPVSTVAVADTQKGSVERGT